MIGAVRNPGTRDGLTRVQAERELQRLVQTATARPAPTMVTVAEAGNRRLEQLEALGRKPSTMQDYRIMLDRHLAPHFASKALDRVTAEDVTGYMAIKRREGLAPKTITNHVTFLHGVFAHAVKRGWIAVNPVAGVDRPRSGADVDIRYLDLGQVDGLLRAVPDDTLGPVEGVLYLTAAMTGLRQGEVLALRWRDVDWTAGVVRVRRSYTRGEFGTPKSRRSSRAVPMADRLAGELDRHYQRSAYQADDDLVFCHPQTGHVLDPSKLLRRFKAALGKAGVREVRFHDLRHTFGTHCAGAGVPLRTLQEWLGHRDFQTTLIYADYLPSGQEAQLVEQASPRRS